MIAIQIDVTELNSCWSGNSYPGVNEWKIIFFIRDIFDWQQTEGITTTISKKSTE